MGYYRMITSMVKGLVGGMTNAEILMPDQAGFAGRGIGGAKYVLKERY